MESLPNTRPIPSPGASGPAESARADTPTQQGQPPSIAFIGWNPFQFLHFGRIVSKFPDATLIIERRKKGTAAFDFKSICMEQDKVLCLDRKTMQDLDGRFDVLVCQTPFAGIERIRRSKIAMLQYGYAKEAHNFAPWRSFGDMCMTFGDYASRKMEPFCPTVTIGNPRYEDWEHEIFHQAAREKYRHRLDPSKRTLLYAPTWGPLSSYGEFGEALLELSSEYNVILKIHHNTESARGRHMEPVRQKFGVIHGANDDIVELLSVADVMVTDFSGAIFDAIYCKVPVVLLDSNRPQCPVSSKSDSHSIERARRRELGVTISSPGDLAGAIRQALEPAQAQLTPAPGLRAELFLNSRNASDRAAAAIRALAAGAFPQGQHQSYIREEMRNYYASRNEFRTLKFLHRMFRRGLGAIRGDGKK